MLLAVKPEENVMPIFSAPVFLILVFVFTLVTTYFVANYIHIKWAIRGVIFRRRNHTIDLLWQDVKAINKSDIWYNTSITSATSVDPSSGDFLIKVYFRSMNAKAMMLLKRG